MHFSCKIKKFYEGMQVYEHLLDDEKAIHIPFALSFTVTIATINDQLKTYLMDLEKGECQEIPDIDFDLVTNVFNIMSPKLKRDMAALGNKTIQQQLEELFGEQLNKTPAELHRFVYDNTVLMTEYLKKIRMGLEHADGMLFVDYVCRHIREQNWEDIESNYLKWKNFTEPAWDQLMEKQEQELEKYLEKGIMRFAPLPSNSKLSKVDYASHLELLECNFTDRDEYKVAYTQFRLFATRKDGMLTVNLKKYGKYIFKNFSKFSEGQKVALFELIVILNLIHKDMVALKPELSKYMMAGNNSLQSLENTKLFAPYFHIKEMLKGEWFKDLRTDAKYNGKWADAFAEGLIRSEYGSQIADDWKEKANQLKGYVIGCLKEAGVIKASISNDSIAKVAGIMEKSRSFSKYIGKESQEQPYAGWILKHVNDYC
jgi:hypothetical protein